MCPQRLFSNLRPWGTPNRQGPALAPDRRHAHLKAASPTYHGETETPSPYWRNHGQNVQGREMRPYACRRVHSHTNPRLPPPTPPWAAPAAAHAPGGPCASPRPVMAARRPRGAAGAGGGGGHWLCPARPPPPAAAENGGAAAAAGLLRGAVSGRLPGAGPAGAGGGGVLAAPGREHGREDLPAVRRGGRAEERGSPAPRGRPCLGPTPPGAEPGVGCAPGAGSAAGERCAARPGGARLPGSGGRQYVSVRSRRALAQARLRSCPSRRCRPGLSFSRLPESSFQGNAINC